MNPSIRKAVKNYYGSEVLSMSVPPLPEGVTGSNTTAKSGRDALLLAAILFSSLVTISIPPIYESPIRRAYIPISTIEAFKEDFPRVFFEASLKYKELKGV